MVSIESLELDSLSKDISKVSTKILDLDLDWSRLRMFALQSQNKKADEEIWQNKREIKSVCLFFANLE